MHQFIVCTDTNNISFCLKSTTSKLMKILSSFWYFQLQKICSLSVYLLKTRPLSNGAYSIIKQLCHWSVKTFYIRSSITSCQIWLIICYFLWMQTLSAQSILVIGYLHLFIFRDTWYQWQQILLIWKMKGQHFIILRKLFDALVVLRVVNPIRCSARNISI